MYWRIHRPIPQSQCVVHAGGYDDCIALDGMANNPRERGFTVIELLIVVAIISIVAALAIAGLLRAKMAANEASAVGSLRAINSAQHVYATSCANGFYASSLPILYSPPSGGASFISPDLGIAATVMKSGFVITVARATDGATGVTAACNPLGVAGDLTTAYYATANPASMTSGTRHLWTSRAGTIYADSQNAINHTEGNSVPPPPAAPLESSAP